MSRQSAVKRRRYRHSEQGRVERWLTENDELLAEQASFPPTRESPRERTFYQIVAGWVSEHLDLDVSANYVSRRLSDLVCRGLFRLYRGDEAPRIPEKMQGGRLGTAQWSKLSEAYRMLVCADERVALQSDRLIALQIARHWKASGGPVGIVSVQAVNEMRPGRR